MIVRTRMCHATTSILSGYPSVNHLFRGIKNVNPHAESVYTHAEFNLGIIGIKFVIWGGGVPPTQEGGQCPLVKLV